MYVHLGADVTVRDDAIIGIFDLDKTTVGHSTRDFLAAAERGSAVTNVTGDLPKSFVVTVEQGTARVYITSISSTTLKGRVEAGGVDRD